MQPKPKGKPTETLMKKTPLHAAHLALKAKMAEFAGYDMPIQYETGVLAEHNWTREHCGLFDVSHMGQIAVEGPGAAGFWEKVTPSSIRNMGLNMAKYTVLTTDKGGIIDDLILTRLSEDRFFAVLNAGCKDRDIFWLETNMDSGATLAHFHDRALLAIQGPKSESVLRDVFNIDATDLGYMRSIRSGDFFISRLGYTGEDGFEISLPDKIVAGIWDRLLQHPEVKPIGLAARDSLRLEMGYPLYGHDLSTEISPVEADLAWVIGKDRAGYHGEWIIKPQMAGGVSRLRVGIKLTEKGVAREGAPIFTASGKKLGDLTSGGFSPTLNQAIGQGYIDPRLGKIGDDVLVRVRDRDIKAVLASMPFVQPKTKAAKSRAA